MGFIIYHGYWDPSAVDVGIKGWCGKRCNCACVSEGEGMNSVANTVIVWIWIWNVARVLVELFKVNGGKCIVVVSVKGYEGL